MYLLFLRSDFLSSVNFCCMIRLSFSPDEKADRNKRHTSVPNCKSTTIADNSVPLTQYDRLSIELFQFLASIKPALFHYIMCAVKTLYERMCVPVQGSIYSLFLYDAVYLYMTMMNQIVSEGLDWRNGTFWLNMARNWVTNGQ